MLSLGIDIGTSGVRSSVIEGTRLISTARAAHPPQNPKKIDASKWWEAAADCLHQQVAALTSVGRHTEEIACLAIDGTSGSMVLTDGDLCPVSPALMYNSKGFDAEAARIAKIAPADHVTKGSNSALARAMRLVSLANRAPVHLLHQADFVAAKLLGVGGNSDFNNTLKTGFDPATESWPDWISEVIDPSLLPKVHAPGDAIGHIDPSVADEFGLSHQTRLHAGTTDSVAAFLAASPLESGNAVTSLGSTLAVKLLSPERIDDPAVGLYAHRIGSTWLVGGASNTGGAVLKAFFDDATLERLSQRIDPSQKSDLVYYPLLEPGERFPINDPDLKPQLSPRPAEDDVFLHGLLESMSRIEAACYKEITMRGASMPKRIFTAGGGAKNAVWRVIRERHLGLRPSIADQNEASFGTARLASQFM